MKKCFKHYRLLALMMVVMLSLIIPAIPVSYGNTLPLAAASMAVSDQSTDATMPPGVASENSNFFVQQTTANASSTPSTIFNDVSSQDSNSLFINYLHYRGLIEGFPDGGFHPNTSLTRAEAATLLVQAAGLSNAVNTNSFPDVPAIHWAASNINLAAKAGLIRGYADGTFRPDQPVSRSEGITMILNLSRQPAPGTLLPILNDVSDIHWAARSIAIGLAAKMVTLSSDQQFFPDNPFSRSDFSRALAVMLIKNPDLARTTLTGELSWLKGSVYLVKTGTNNQVEFSGQVALNPGDTIITGSDGAAQILFPDGTGLLLKENTTLVIKDNQGRSYILPDGKPGTAVEMLRVDLKAGKIFGILATRYDNVNTNTSAGTAEAPLRVSQVHMRMYPESKSTVSDGIKLLRIAEEMEFLRQNQARWQTYSDAGTADASLRASQAHMLMYQGNRSTFNDGLKLVQIGEETEFFDQSQPWWQTYTEERERLVIDMPWGTAGIRGTGFQGEVDLDGSSLLSILFGDGYLKSNGQTVNLGPGQYSQIITLLTSPTTPATMTPEQRQAWLQVKDWLEERAREIQSRMEWQPQLETSLSQELQTINTVLDLLNNALNNLSSGLSTTNTSGGEGDGDAASATYTVAYNGNGNDGGAVPTNSNSYASGSSVTVLGNSAELYKNGYSYGGWNTAVDGSGTSYNEGDTFNIAGNITLYAVWYPITYTVTYDGNGNDEGSVPASVTDYIYDATVVVLANTQDLYKIGCSFDGWNTAADGSGTNYSADDTFRINGNITLYAVWSCTLTYDGNGAIAGSVPAGITSYMYDSTVMVLGNTKGLYNSDYGFDGWNTAADGSGTSYSPGDTFQITGNTTLYAVWTG